MMVKLTYRTEEKRCSYVMVCKLNEQYITIQDDYGMRYQFDLENGNPIGHGPYKLAKLDLEMALAAYYGIW